MRLQQGQVWSVGESYLRIVRLDRQSVAFKELTDLRTRDGRHQEMTKKGFCRLIKTGRLLAPEELPDRWSTLVDPAD